MGDTRGATGVAVAPRHAIAVLLCLACLAPTILSAESVTLLPGPGFAGLAVDDRHGHLFVTQLASTVEVFDFAGAPVASIGGQLRAAGMALNRTKSRLFVAQGAGDAIAEVDTVTLQEVRRHALGLGGACPGSLAFVGNRVWFGFTCEGQCPCQLPTVFGGIGSLRLRRDVVETHQGGDFPFYDPLLASSRRLRNVLVAGEGSVSPGTLYRYRIAHSDVPVLEARNFDPGDSENLQNVALVAGVRQILTASGFPYHVSAFRLDDLTDAGTYQTGPYPVAVAVTGDERFVAAGVDAPYDPDVYVFPLGGDVPVNVYELGPGSPGAPTLAPGGPAFDPTGPHLFPVRASFFDDPSALHVITMPLVPTTTTTTTSTSTTTTPVPCGSALFPQMRGHVRSRRDLRAFGRERVGGLHVHARSAVRRAIRRVRRQLSRGDDLLLDPRPRVRLPDPSVEPAAAHIFCRTRAKAGRSVQRTSQPRAFGAEERSRPASGAELITDATLR